MNAKLNGERGNSRQWQSALESALAAHGGESALAHYAHIALAFPSSHTLPYAFGHPLIDYQQLKAWAVSRGWRVRPAPGKISRGERYRLPVRFTRLTQIAVPPDSISQYG